MLRVFLASPRFAARRRPRSCTARSSSSWLGRQREAIRRPCSSASSTSLPRRLGAWHLVDYKTNQVTPRTLAKVAADYEMQMLLYALAAETTLGVAPVELVLHFLRGGLEYSFPWDSPRRPASASSSTRRCRPATPGSLGSHNERRDQGRQ